MPMKPAAAKALRQSKKNRERNVAARGQITKLIKTARKHIAEKKWEEAKTTVRAAAKAMDKAVARGITKKNTAARLKSRLMTALNAGMKAK